MRLVRGEGTGLRAVAVKMTMLKGLAAGAIWVCFLTATAMAQENYEIQVYPSETMAPGTLLVELHSNYTVEGSTA